MSLNDSIRQYYGEVLNPRFVTKELLEQLLELPSPWDEENFYGLVTFYRTYSRWIPRLKRRESWAEVCLRVTEYSFSLLDHLGKAEDYINEGEVEEFLLNLYKMNFLTSGRTLWRGDKNSPDATANYNCSFLTIDSYQKYAEMAYLLMCGAGTGFSVEKKYVSKLPHLYYDVDIEYRHNGTTLRGNEYTSTTVSGSAFFIHILHTEIGNPVDRLNEQMKEHESSFDGYKAVIKVGDSRLGWATAFDSFFNLLSGSIPPGKIIIDFSEVRPAGTPLRTMGGTASGHEVLEQAFRKIAWIIWISGGVLKPINAMDVANCIAECIVAGGVRRSAQIALGDWDDMLFVMAKHHLYSGEEPDPTLVATMWEREGISFEVDRINPKYRWRKSRVMSNNSVMLYDDIEKEELDELFQYVQEFGEPGFINATVAKSRFSGFKGVNPCAEILLDDRGLCNIGEVVLPKAYDNVAIYKSISCLTKHLLRITLAPLFMKEWTKVNQKYRLLGVGLCGINEFIDNLKWDEDRVREFYTLTSQEAWVAATKYSKRLGISIPYNVTTIKPGGSLPQLPGVSSGMHRSYSPFFIHRIRVGVDHPINKVLVALGIQVDPEVGFTMENTPRYVYSIPCKTATEMRSLDEPAIAQLERYKMLMKHYCDQNVSCTIQIDGSEIEVVKEWLMKNQRTFVGISFFPKFDPDLMSTPMPLLPYETCTEDKYIPYKFSEETFFNLFSTLRDVQAEDEDEANQESCETGLCPQR